MRPKVERMRNEGGRSLVIVRDICAEHVDDGVGCDVIA